MMQDYFKYKTALISGATSEIGRQIALKLAKNGCNLVLMGRNPDKLNQFAIEAEQFGQITALPFKVDISKPVESERIFEDSLKKLGPPDILVNAAGIFDWASAFEADMATWDNLINVNLTAAMRLTRLALPYMVAQSHGAIIFIASMAARQSFGMNAAYVASKHGLLGFAGSVFEDVRNKNIKVCTICPGLVNAGASLVLQKEPSELIQPANVADAVEFVLKFPSNACPTEIVIQPQLNPYRTEASQL